MCVLKAFGNLRDDLQTVFDFDRDVCLHQTAQFLAFQELHRHVGDPFAATDIVNGDDIAVGKSACRPGLLIESCFVLDKLFLGQGEIDGLDRDNSIKHRIMGLAHDTHGALTDLGNDFVAPQLGRDTGLGHG